MHEEGYLRPGGKKLILESPVLKSHTGTLLAATGRIKHYSDTEQSALTNKFLDTVCFTSDWSQRTLDILKQNIENGSVLSVGSKEDGVSDIEGFEGSHFNAVYEVGKHARLWREEENDFKIVEEFLKKT